MFYTLAAPDKFLKCERVHDVKLNVKCSSSQVRKHSAQLVNDRVVDGVLGDVQVALDDDNVKINSFF